MKVEGSNDNSLLLYSFPSIPSPLIPPVQLKFPELHRCVNAPPLEDEAPNIKSVVFIEAMLFPQQLHILEGVPKFLLEYPGYLKDALGLRA